MPRRSRIDAPGALHHIIARGIDRGKIFQDPADKRNFLKRLAEILKGTKTHCTAWALIPNHILYRALHNAWFPVFGLIILGRAKDVSILG